MPEVCSQCKVFILPKLRKLNPNLSANFDYNFVQNSLSLSLIFINLWLKSSIWFPFADILLIVHLQQGCVLYVCTSVMKVIWELIYAIRWKEIIKVEDIITRVLKIPQMVCTWLYYKNAWWNAKPWEVNDRN